mmetsp:Transcript_17532/g.35077  ORF Transcript_17532/g.35077 Transcript_17532/m.35077 type:complete len:126 (+) Transcript_17532:57-434(+)
MVFKVKWNGGRTALIPSLELSNECPSEHFVAGIVVTFSTEDLVNDELCTFRVTHQFELETSRDCDCLKFILKFPEDQERLEKVCSSSAGATNNKAFELWILTVDRQSMEWDPSLSRRVGIDFENN